MSYIVYAGDEGKSATGGKRLVGSGSRMLLASGLTWTILAQSAKDTTKESAKPGPKSGLAKIGKKPIRQSMLRNGATAFVLHRQSDIARLGMYSPPLATKQAKGKLYSLAAAFLADLLKGVSSDAQASAINAVLLMQPQSGSSGRSNDAEKRVLIIVQGGAIFRDLVIDKSKAIDQVREHLATGLSTTLFSEFEGDVFHSKMYAMDWDKICAVVRNNESQARLQSRPLPGWLPAALLASIALTVASTSYYQLVVVPANKRALAAELARLDTTPAYVLASDQELSKAGWARDNLADFLAELRNQSVFVSGWALEKLECNMADCTYRFARRAGLVNDLEKAMPFAKLDFAASSLESAVMVRTLEASDKRFANWSRNMLQGQTDSLLLVRPVLQKLTNAGVTATVGEPQKWSGVDLKGVLPQSILMLTPVEMSMRLDLAREALATLPPSLLIKSFALTINSDSVKVNFKGSVYAHQ